MKSKGTRRARKRRHSQRRLERRAVKKMAAALRGLDPTPRSTTFSAILTHRQHRELFDAFYSPSPLYTYYKEYLV